MLNFSQLSDIRNVLKSSILSVNNNLKEQSSWLTVWEVKRADGANSLKNSKSVTKTSRVISWFHQVWSLIWVHSQQPSELRLLMNGLGLLAKGKFLVQKYTHSYQSWATQSKWGNGTLKVYLLTHSPYKMVSSSSSQEDGHCVSIHKAKPTSG